MTQRNIARLTDRTFGTCFAHPVPLATGGTIITASPNVFANNLGVARVGDIVEQDCGHTTKITTGSTDTKTNNRLTARIGDIVSTDGPYVAKIISGSPDVFVNPKKASNKGAGAIIDNNIPYNASGVPVPIGVNPNPPIGYENITSADVYVYENNDSSDNTNPPPPGTTTQEMTTTVTDNIQPPPETPTVQDCSVIDQLDDNFTWTSQESDFGKWAAGFSLSNNFTVANMCYGAVGAYEFTSNAVQTCGLTQKEILKNMCHHAKTVLEPILENYGEFTITSGFRNKSGTSQHNKGQATDLQFLSYHGKNNTGDLYFEVAQNIRDNISYDQMILEWFGRNPWIHISSNQTNHRKQVLTQVSSSSYVPGLMLLSHS